MLAAAAITTAVMILTGVRHEPAVRSWAMHPRTPARIARRISAGVTAVATATASAVLIAGSATLLVIALVGAMNQAAGAL